MVKYMNSKGEEPWHYGFEHKQIDEKPIERLIEKIQIKEDDLIADLASGPGRFSIEFAKRVNKGLVYAIDISEEALETLKDSLNKKKINNVKILLADISKKIPLDNNSIDIVFMANAFHGFVHGGTWSNVLKEAYRILKSDGKLAILEFKKTHRPPGPPINIRISYEELSELLLKEKFTPILVDDIEDNHYLVISRPK